MSIKAVEDHLVQRVKARFGNRLKAVESLPSDWDTKTVDRIFRGAPGVFVVFTGGPAITGMPEIRSRWVLVAVTAHAGDEPPRRHGDTREIGAYEICEVLVQLLHDTAVPGVGTLQFTDIANLFDAVNEAKGLALYGVAFDLPMVIAPADPGEGDVLDDFVTFHSDTDLSPADGTPEASDTVTLPQ